MLDPPPYLRRTLRINATHRHLGRIFYHSAAALRAFRRHGEFLFAARAQVRANAHDRWNDLARFLDNHGVTDSNVLARKFFFVVQSGSTDGAAAHEYWLEHGHGCEHTGAADLNQNVAQLCFDSFRFVLEGNGPPRRF